MTAPDCSLCAADGGVVLHRAGMWRVVRADEPGFPAFYRVICEQHVAEFTDLPAAERQRCMDLVARVEAAVRSVLSPGKVNLASLGNMVPHLHWHVVARFPLDRCFPSPVWSPPQREDSPTLLNSVFAQLPAVEAELRRTLADA